MSSDYFDKIPKRINVGCGRDKREGFLNIDSDPAADPDYLVVDNDLSSLPRGYFLEIVAKDVLEHIPRVHMMGALFDWVELLAPEGTIYIQTSSIFGIIDVMRAAGDFETIHNWKQCLFGNQAHPGDWHFNGFTEETLEVYLCAVGLKNEGFSIEDGWLISTTAIRKKSWAHLEEIKDYREFVTTAYLELLGRQPESDRLNWGPTDPFSVGRRHEIRALVCSDERLYWLGRTFEKLCAK